MSTPRAPTAPRSSAPRASIPRTTACNCASRPADAPAARTRGPRTRCTPARKRRPRRRRDARIKVRNAEKGPRASRKRAGQPCQLQHRQRGRDRGAGDGRRPLPSRHAQGEKTSVAASHGIRDPLRSFRAMIAVDTNVLVRYIVEDDPQQSSAAAAMIERAVKRDETIFVPQIVLCELVWVLSFAYRYKREAIAGFLHQLRRGAQLVVEG